MKITGFTFIRNAIKYDYPILESIQSILPLCDEFVVAVGKSDDDTLQYIQAIPSDKIKIIETVWDDSQRESGRVLALETDKAYAAIADDTDWAFYIQGDEVVHEKYLENIRAAMERWKDATEVQGLLFNYRHFYGSYDYVGDSYRWYRKEVRVVRYHPKVYSYRDAQGFRWGEGQKLKVKPVNAYVYHYGWVKEPKAMQDKQQTFNKYWHDDAWVAENVLPAEAFDYSNIDALTLFEGEHPQVMKERIRRKNWSFEHDISIKRFTTKEKLKRMVEKWTGYRIGEYRNYRNI